MGNRSSEMKSRVVARVCNDEKSSWVQAAVGEKDKLMRKEVVEKLSWMEGPSIGISDSPRMVAETAWRD